ncbi:ArnT family glycosyltransferase [Haloplanus sp. C73]|uniref:ArnT family glycosyltransferase n=1 Tax=Haloplanus sp. C73 TaxID=3421641 RepID=UPI003EB7C942
MAPLSLRDCLPETAVFLACLVGYLPKLSFPLSTDEAIYFSVAREMARDGHWLIPVYTGTTDIISGTVFLEKPPLVFWLQALSIDVLGATPAAVRVPSVVATAACAVVVVRIARTFYDDRTGLAAGLVFLTMPAIFWYGNGGRTATTDIFLLLFGTLFVWFGYRSRASPRYLWYAGVAGGLAVMSKQAAAGLYLLLALPVLLRTLRTGREGVLGGVAAALATALPWNLYALASYPETYLRQMVSEQFLGRLGTGHEPLHGQTYSTIGPFNPFYVVRFPVYLGPFVISTAAGAYFAAVDARHGAARDESLFLLWWLAFPVALFTVLTSSTWIHYVIASVVPAAVLSGYAIIRTAPLVREHAETRAVAARIPTAPDIVTWTALAVAVLLAYPVHQNV